MSRGRFGVHGGQYMSETLMNELLNLEEQYNHFKEDPECRGIEHSIEGICRTTFIIVLCKENDRRPWWVEDLLKA